MTAPVLERVDVMPINPTVVFYPENPPTIEFWAYANYSSGPPAILLQSLNWTSDNTNVATINTNTGLATATGAGRATISATYSGMTGNTTMTVLPDTVMPSLTLTSPTEGLIISGNALRVAGTVDDTTAATSVIVNGGAPIALPLDANGYFTQGVNLNTGNNTILVKAVDGTGNTATSGTRTVVVDPRKPDITITLPSSGIVTNNPLLTVSGNVSSATSATLRLNGVPQSLSVTGGSFNTNVVLLEGENIIVVNAYAIGHTGEPDYLGTSGISRAILDATPPVITIIEPVPGQVFHHDNSFSFSGMVHDPGVSTVNTTLNGKPGSCRLINGYFEGVSGTLNTPYLLTGNNTYVVTATDKIGNTATRAITFICDTASPEVKIHSLDNHLITGTSNQTVTGKVSDPAITAATLYLNGSPRTIPVSSYSFSENVTLTAGINTLEVRATNAAGNTGSSGVVQVVLDNIAPRLIVGLSDPTDAINIDVTSNEELCAAPVVSINPTIVMTPVGVNRWKGTYGSPASPIAPDSYSVNVTGTDRAGNTNIARASFGKMMINVDGVSPTVVATPTATLEVETNVTVSNANISVAQHGENPSGNVRNPNGAEIEAGVFLEIVGAPELLNSLKQVYIEVNYNPAKLAPDTDESTLKLYLWDTTTGTWLLLPGSGVNMTDKYVYGTATRLTKYGVFGSAGVVVPPSQVEWFKTFGGGANDAGECVQQTSDGGYIITGYTGSFGGVYLVKTDPSGNMLWSHAFGGGKGNSVQQTSDGGYVIAGQITFVDAGSSEVYLIKTDASGSMTWSQTFRGTDLDIGYSVQQTSDGGYIITGYTESFGAGSGDVYLIKTDSSGNMTWSQTFGGSSQDRGDSIQKTSDGGYIIAGYTHSFGTGLGDVYLIKTDNSGNMTWSRTFGHAHGTKGYSVQQTSDGGYIIAGYAISSGAGIWDVYLVKTDASGNMTWSRTFGGPSYDVGYSVRQTLDGGYIVVGRTDSFGAGSRDLYVVKTDSSGNMVWSQTFGGGGVDQGQSIQLTSDGGYIITGWTNSFGAGMSDVYLIKLPQDYLPLPGDTNGDGLIDAIDITKVERIIVHLDIPTPGADANQDGFIDAVDITKVERLIVHLD